MLQSLGFIRNPALGKAFREWRRWSEKAREDADEAARAALAADRLSEQEQQLMAEAARRIDGPAVSKAIVDAVTSTGIQAVPLRAVGGIYWLPADTAEKWRKLAAGIEAARISGYAKCWSITTVGDVESVRAVADAFVREMESEIASAEQSILDGDLNADKLRDLADRLMDRQELGDKFSGILGTSLEAITNRLDDVRVRAAQAASLVA